MDISIIKLHLIGGFPDQSTFSTTCLAFISPVIRLHDQVGRSGRSFCIQEQIIPTQHFHGAVGQTVAAAPLVTREMGSSLYEQVISCFFFFVRGNLPLTFTLVSVLVTTCFNHNLF